VSLLIFGNNNEPTEKDGTGDNYFLLDKDDRKKGLFQLRTVNFKTNDRYLDGEITIHYCSKQGDFELIIDFYKRIINKRRYETMRWNFNRMTPEKTTWKTNLYPEIQRQFTQIKKLIEKKRERCCNSDGQKCYW
jgi:hypothetical protein